MKRVRECVSESLCVCVFLKGCVCVFLKGCVTVFFFFEKVCVCF